MVIPMRSLVLATTATFAPSAVATLVIIGLCELFGVVNIPLVILHVVVVGFRFGWGFGLGRSGWRPRCRCLGHGM